MFEARARRAIRTALARWFERVQRDLPWRATRDPYRIWLSEVMLQQTRAAAVIPYYERFLARFPEVRALAEAPEAEVLTLWAGLGYYSRARNLHRAAQRIVSGHGGEFPREYAAIRDLPGVGDYTAAAVASIAFGLPHAVLDGNVARVLSRLVAEPGEIQAPATRRRLQELAELLMDRRRPGDSNQAWMELGATVCLPRKPLCLSCPAGKWCAARAGGNPATFPVQTNYKILVESTVTVAIIEERNSVLLRRRGPQEKRLAGFWELPEPASLPGFQAIAEIGAFRHAIVNHRYAIAVVSGRTGRVPDGYEWLDLRRLREVPLTTISRKALALASIFQA